MKYYLGVDLGGTNIASGIVDEEYNIIAKYSVPTKPERGFQTVVAEIANTAKKVTQMAGLKIEALESFGMGVPCSVNPATNNIVHANNLGWINVPIFTELAKHLDLPCYIRNDADCAALGEVLAGGAKGHRNVVMITLGTGVGGGVVLNNNLFSGADQMGCEFGHTTFVFEGRPCNCGLNGCWEQYASAKALIKMATEAMEQNPDSLLNTLCKQKDRLTGKIIFDAIERNDKVTVELLDRYLQYVAGGLSTFVTTFRPEIVIIGGGLCAAGDLIIDPLNNYLKKYSFAAEHMGIPKVLVAKLGNDAGIIGAAMLCKHTN